jgi:hypothetical protein
MTASRVPADAASQRLADELEDHLEQARSDPEFRAAYARAQHWDTHHPLPLAIDGHAYRHRQMRRTKRRR